MASIYFTEEQIAVIRGFLQRGPNSDGNYADAYDAIAAMLPDGDVKLWLQGAAMANAGLGVFSEIIRKYSAKQMELRGVAYSEALMQAASNQVAINALTDILAPARDQGNGLWLAPTIADIANNDATGVGQVLFAGLGDDSAGGATNAGWSGAILFSALGSNQTYRLTANGGPGLNTLDDIKNVLFAFEAYAYAYEAAKSYAGQVYPFDRQMLSDIGIGIDTILSSNLNELRALAVDNLTLLLTGDAQQLGSLISEAGAPAVLDWLKATVSGSHQAAPTSADNFASAAQAFFSNINTSGIPAQLLTGSKQDIVALASGSAAVRNALMALSPIAVDLPSYAHDLSLLNEDTGEGALSQEWIDKRSSFLVFERLYRETGQDGGVFTMPLGFPAPIAGDVEFRDYTSGSEYKLVVDGLDAGLIDKRYFLFGGAAGDHLDGDDGDDYIFGMDGADTLGGGEGDDYIEGGSGDDAIDGGADDDEIHGGKGNDLLFGGTGKDLIYGESGDDVLWGQSSTSADDNGEDKLYGGDGDDQIHGASGRTLLDGGAGADRLEGGSGFDTYRADAADSILDVDGKGEVFLGKSRLTGGSRKQQDPENEYRGGGTLYVLNGTKLTINGGLVIDDFENGDLGIYLRTEPDDEEKPDMGPAETRASPLTIDLNGDGVRTLAYSTGRYFDHDGNGLLESTAWADTADGLLVRDLNANGLIDDGRELFGSNTRMRGGTRAANGFIALSELDENGDGAVDAGDSAFSTLRIWRDANGNGVTEAGELLTLDQAGIASFNTAWSSSTLVDGNGQAHKQVGSATRIDGSSAAVSDVWYTTDASIRLNQIDVPVEAIFDSYGVPDAKAFGNLADLRQAAALDNDLRGLVEAYASSSDAEQRNQLLDRIIFRWAGVSAVLPTSRGSYVDARELAVVELLSGRPYTNEYTPNDPIPRREAGNLLTSEFDKFRQFVGAQLRAQTDYADSGIFLGGFASGYTHAIVGWDAFKAYMLAAQDNGEPGKITDLVILSTTLASYSPVLRSQLDAAYVDLVAARPTMAPLLDVLSAETGTDQVDVIYGGAGRDAVNGKQGDDTLYGQAGDDIYIYRPGDGSDRIFDSSGSDQIYFMGGILPSELSLTRDVSSIIVRVNSAGQAGEIRINNVYEGTEGALREGVIEQFRFENGTTWNLTQILSAVVQQATSGDDGLFGSSGNETFSGLEGNDEIAGYGGNDTINGDGGNDTLSGGTGNDTLDGGAGQDSLDGGDGDDVLIGGAGNDTLGAGAGNDRYVFRLGDGQDTINNLDTGSSRLDALEFGAGIAPSAVVARRVGLNLVLTITGTDDKVTVANYFSGDAAGSYRLDEIRFTDAAATIWNVAAIKAMVLAPTDGNDVLQGYETDDTIAGGNGNDTLSGNGGADVLSGQAGGDILNGGGGNDTLLGGIGDDTLAGGAGSDTYVFNVGDGQDVISDYDTSTGRLDVLQFGAGISADAVTARRSGNDLILTIATGQDKVTVVNYFQGDAAGGYRVDEIKFTGAGTPVWDVASIKSLVLAPTSGDDILRGYETSDTLAGGDGNDTLYGNGGDDVLQGQNGADTLFGGNGNDTLSGGAGIDVLEGEQGDDSLTGGDGNDTLRGGAGSDHLTGGAGDDQLQGGAGADFYHFAAGDGRDTVSDNEGLNTIYLSGLPLDQVYFRRENTALAVYFANSPNDRILLTDFFDPLTQLSRFSLTLDWGNGQQWLLDPAAIDSAALLGTALDDVIYGNTQDNALSGLAGSDTIYGAAGADQLDGGLGNDYLFGDAGSDTLLGGDGNDLLDGGLGTDQLQGGAGDDIYMVDDAGDIVSEVGGSGLDLIRSNVSFALPEDVEQLTLIGEADIDATGNGAANTLIGNSGANHLSGLSGDDSLDGRQGVDLLDGGEGNDILDGGDDEDELIGGAGNDLLIGGSSIDLLRGGTGDDIYRVDQAGDVIVELTAEGFDEVNSTADQYTLSDNLERLVLVEGSAAQVAIGSGGANELIGNSASNRLDGAGGDDYMAGGLGDDTYVVDTTGDQVVELTGAGNDTVESSIDYVLGATLENLILTGGADLRGTGNESDNVLVGNTGANRLDGGLGGDDMYGGAGDDYFINDSSQDWIYEYAGEGADTVERRYETNLVLSANVENLILATGVTTGNGNDLNNTVTGNASNNTLAGLNGNDVLYGLDGDDNLFGGAGTDTLYGGGGADYLDGGAGVDQLEGGDGNDIYITDSSSDVVVEAAGAGTDQVQTTASYALSANIESLFLMGNSAIDGTGNDLDNYIAGNAAANVIHGSGGSDTIVAGGGDDTLYGGTGDDKYVFDVNSGTDVIDNSDGGFDGVFFTNGVTRERLTFGRIGDDLLIFVDGASTPSVRVLNHFLGGNAAIDYVQPDGGSYLTTAEINQIVSGGSTGGQFDQVIQGTASGEQLVGGTGKDLIEGLGGADTLFGMGGDDTLRGGDGNDYLSGGNGGGTGSGNDILEGGAGDDTLRGEDGSNTLTGGAGDDQYIYGGGIDVIDNTGGGTDWLFFQNGITAAQLGFTRSGDDLVITVNGNANQRVTVIGHFLGGDMALDYLQPASGSALNTAAINALVSNNGGGGDPGSGTPGTGNDADYPSVKTGTSAGEQIVGTSGRDLIKGLGGADTLFGMGGDDKLDGGDGDDYLSGGNGSFSGSGSDILIGGAGNDQLVGEDGDDMLFGGVGDDTYFYAAGSGADTVDNTGGGTDWLYFDGIARTRLTYHRDGDDLIVRVDGDAAQQIRVLDHFLGSDHAIAYVQPGDGGYAIPASTIAGQLTPLESASHSAATMAMGGMQARETSSLPIDEGSQLALAMEAFAIDAPVLKAPASAQAIVEPAVRRPLDVVLASSDPVAMRSSPEPPTLSATAESKTSPVDHVNTEVQQLVESLASFASRGGISATNDMVFAEPLAALGATPSWRVSHRNDGLHLRQLER